jgi:hypothetical protein
VLFALGRLEDPRLAWDQAAALRLDDDHTLSLVAKAYEPIDPRAVMPIHRRLVEHELVNAGVQHYRLAAQRLAKMRRRPGVLTAVRESVLAGRDFADVSRTSH